MFINIANKIPDFEYNGDYSEEIDKMTFIGATFEDVIYKDVEYEWANFSFNNNGDLSIEFYSKDYKTGEEKKELEITMRVSITRYNTQ